MTLPDDADIYAMIDWAIQHGSQGPQTHKILLEVRKHLGNEAENTSRILLGTGHATLSEMRREFDVMRAEVAAWREWYDRLNDGDDSKDDEIEFISVDAAIAATDAGSLNHFAISAMLGARLGSRVSVAHGQIGNIQNVATLLSERPKEPT